MMMNSEHIVVYYWIIITDHDHLSHSWSNFGEEKYLSAGEWGLGLVTSRRWKMPSLYTSKLQSCLNVGWQDLFVSFTSNLINLHVIWRPHCVVLINMETVPAGLTSHRDRHPGHGIGQSRWNGVSGQLSLSTCQSLFLREILLSWYHIYW